MTTGQLNKSLSERLAERRAQQLEELDELSQMQLNEHERALKQLLNDVQRTTESAIRSQSKLMSSALSDAEQRQGQQIESIEKRLAAAAHQAERLSRVGGLRSWARPMAITTAMMLAVGLVTAGGLLMVDRLIDRRWEQLSVLNEEIQKVEQMPRLPAGVKIQTIQGDPYLVLKGTNPQTVQVQTIDNGQTPVVKLTRED